MTRSDDLAFLDAHRPEADDPTPAATASARAALLEHTAAAERPAESAARTSRPTRRPRRGVAPRRGGWRVVAVCAAVAACLTAAVVGLPAGDGGGGGLLSPQEAAASPLYRLANQVRTLPTGGGDATLVQRVTRSNGKVSTGADLYLDGGRYVYARTPERLGLPATRTSETGWITGILRATSAASTRSLDAARTGLLGVVDPDGELDGAQQDNRIWIHAMDALTAGSGRSDVRAGAMRLLSTVRAVEVRRSTVQGRPTLVARNTATDDYDEVLTLDGRTGTPIRYAAGSPGGPPSTTVTFRVQRVTSDELLDR